MNNTQTRNDRNLIGIAIIAVCFLTLFFPVINGLISVWKGSEDYSHGFLIVPISLYIIWIKKDIIAGIPIQGSRYGIIVIVCSLILYIIAKYADILTFAPVSMVLCLFGIVLYMAGFRMLRELLFPLCFLFFMIPVPAQIYSALTIPLQLFVTKVSVAIAEMLSIPIYREGNVIHLSEKTLQVVQACSGLRSMISLLMLSAIFGYLTMQSNGLRFILFVTGVPIAIFVNIIRVLVMIAGFHYFNADLTEGTVHTVLGIALFGISLLLLVIIKRILSQWDK